MIYVNPDYTIPKELINLSPEKWQHILSLVSHIIAKSNPKECVENKSLISTLCEKDNTISRLNKELETQREQMCSITQLFNDEIKKITGSYEKSIDSLKNKFIESNNLELFNKFHEISTDNLKTISDKIDPVYKFFNGSGPTRGSLGEKAVRSMLDSCPEYKNAIITDQSSIKASGDILFEWCDVKCLIEVKNKSVISQGDVDKFIRDIENSKEQYGINSGLFVTTETSTIPKKSKEHIKIEMFEDIPIIYVYLSYGVDSLKLAINCIKQLLPRIKNINNDNYLKFINDQCNYFSKEISLKTTELKKIKEKYKEIIIVRNSLLSNNLNNNLQSSLQSSLNNDLQSSLQSSLNKSTDQVFKFPNKVIKIEDSIEYDSDDSSVLDSSFCVTLEDTESYKHTNSIKTDTDSQISDNKFLKEVYDLTGITKKYKYIRVNKESITFHIKKGNMNYSANYPFKNYGTPEETLNAIIKHRNEKLKEFGFKANDILE